MSSDSLPDPIRREAVAYAERERMAMPRMESGWSWSIVQLRDAWLAGWLARADSAVPSSRARDDDGGATQPVAAGWSDATKYAFEALNPKPRENPNKGLMIQTRAQEAAAPSAPANSETDRPEAGCGYPYCGGNSPECRHCCFSQDSDGGAKP